MNELPLHLFCYFNKKQKTNTGQATVGLQELFQRFRSPPPPPPPTLLLSLLIIFIELQHTTTPNYFVRACATTVEGDRRQNNAASDSKSSSVATLRTPTRRQGRPQPRRRRPKLPNKSWSASSSHDRYAKQATSYIQHVHHQWPALIVP